MVDGLAAILGAGTVTHFRSAILRTGREASGLGAGSEAIGRSRLLPGEQDWPAGEHESRRAGIRVVLVR